MRMIIYCLSFYIILHSILATNLTINNISNIYHPESHQQGLIYEKQIHEHIHTDHKIINTIQTTMKNFLHHRAVHPRFRHWIHTRKIHKHHSTTTPLFSLIQLHPVDEQTTKTSNSLLQILTLKPQTHKQPSFAEFFFQQQLRAFFGHQHEEQHSAPTRSHIKTGLR